MTKFLHTGLLLIAGLVFVGTTAIAQHRDDSIEESWDRAAREKAQQGKQQEQYRWQTEQMQQQTPPEQSASQPSNRWPHLPANPTSHDYFKANAALIDSLSHMYCVSTSYLRTLRNRNEAVKPNTRPAPQEPTTSDDKSFGYEEESWEKDQPKEEPAPPPMPDRGTQELMTLNQELYQLLDKCLNK